MSKAGAISKLEALLSRIRTRATEPRASVAAPRAVVAAVAPAPVAPAPVAAAPVAPAPVGQAATPPPPIVLVPPPVAARPVVSAPPAPPVALASPPAPPAPAAPRIVQAPSPSPPPPAAAFIEDKDEPTIPPPPPVSSETSSDLDFAVDVDVNSTTPQPVTALQPAAAPSPPPPPVRERLDSREQIAVAPSAAPPAASFEMTSVEPASDSDTGPSIEQVEVISEDEGIVGDEDDEIVEAPASSRRPVASPSEEHLADLAFGSEDPQAPHHTPPPKSGRLPAQPVIEYDPDVTGVRPAVAPQDEATQPSAQGVPPAVLVAQAARPRLGSTPDARVTDVIGEAQRFAPATFMALLDASLSL